MSGPHQGYSAGSNAGMSSRPSVLGPIQDAVPDLADPALAQMWAAIEERQRQEVANLMAKQRQQQVDFETAMQRRQPAAAETANGTQPKQDTIARDFLRALGLPTKQKRKHDQVEADSPKSAASGLVSDSSIGPSILRPAALDRHAPDSAISLVLRVGGVEERAKSVPVTSTGERPAKRRLAPNYVPPPGSLAAKVAAMPDVPVLRIGDGRRALSAVPEGTASANPVKFPAALIAPPADDLFPDEPLFGASPTLKQLSIVPAPVSGPSPQAPVPRLALPPSARVEPIEVDAVLPMEQISETNGLPGKIIAPSFGPDNAIITTGPKSGAPTGSSLAETWRDPNVVAKLHRPPKGLIVEVVIPVSKASFLKSKEARMKAKANANPWPHPQDRLHDLECQWGDCEALLDSSKRLKSHVLKNHVQRSTDMICRWDECGAHRRSLRNLEKHMHKKHLHSYLYICPYEGCSKSCPTEAAWRNHMTLDHTENEKILRPLARPAPLLIPESIPPLPDHPVPPHEVLFLPVRQAPISAEFHRELGPWVLRRILGERWHCLPLRAKWSQIRRLHLANTAPSGNHRSQTIQVVFHWRDIAMRFSTGTHIKLFIGMPPWNWTISFGGQRSWSLKCLPQQRLL
ncbi:hypothetical protein CALVIDRAFT_554215 [Calocera viscosa TUFC12733]|uniref:C2H2-type domain-containing protein n=1 Tax=Calocera viscosa (strain TUFC12733) TaxID=1330018 RepID=A0A167NXE5_CALVF|nr:hypothetical protein CALVIDRAFT_554215 [Calocera viscosa TUFC12733]